MSVIAILLCSLSNTLLIKIMETQTILKVFTIEKIISYKLNFISRNCCVLNTVLDYSKNCGQEDHTPTLIH
jgi:hypothetical protein